MQKWTLSVIILWLASACPSSTLKAAADQAEIYGTVRDASGAVIPSAQVSARNTETGFTRSGLTDAEGAFQLPALPVGVYEVTAQVAGFETQIQTGFTLVLSQRLAVTFEMKVSAVSTSIVVESNSLGVAFRQSQIGSNITPQAVASLPLDGRNFVDLASLVPGIAVGGSSAGGAIPISGGQQLRNKNLIVDGASEKEEYGGGFRGQFSLESVREFQVVTNRFSAEYGRSSSGLINVATKSGTNQLHGSLFGFLRHSYFDARNPVAKEKPQFHRYQYGGSAGGPILKDRTHFFGSYERQDLDSPRILVTPQFTGNVPGPRLANLAMAKLDHQYGTKGQLSVRWSLGNSDEENLFVGETVLPSAGMLAVWDTQAVVVNNVYTLSSSMLNETNFQYARSLRDYQYNDPNGPMILRPSSISGRQTLFPLTSRTENRFQVVDNFSWFVNKHSLKAGVDLNRVNIDGVTDTNFKGTYTFISDSPTATPFSYTQNLGDPNVVISNTLVGLYLLDDWKVNPRLTFNLGVRWDGETSSMGSSSDWNNIAPRVGFAWDFLGSGKGVLRGGFGLYYDQVSLIATNDSEIYNGSKVTGIRISNPPYPDPWAGGKPVPVLPQLRKLDPALQTPYSHQTSIGLQRELFSDWVFSADYAFVRGVKLLRTRNLNPIVNGRRLNPAYADIRNVENSGNSYYHALLASVKKRMTKRFDLMASFTLATAKDENQDYNTLPSDNFNLRIDRGPNLITPVNSFVANGIYRMPLGLEFSAIVALRSGTRYNITTGRDSNGDGTINDRPPGVGRNSGIGPSFATVNVRLDKRWSLTERYKLETIFETFNLFNRANLAPPEGNQASANYGRSISASDARQLQFALRLNF